MLVRGKKWAFYKSQFGWHRGILFIVPKREIAFAFRVYFFNTPRKITPYIHKNHHTMYELNANKGEVL